MAKKKYLKDENGITRALSTNELRLEKPLGNENYDVNVFNNNMDKIDVAIKNVKNDLSNIDLTAERVEYSKNECSNVDGALDKLFQSDSEIKTSILGIKDSVKSVVNSVSETDIASSKAVKIAYDKGTEALSKANEAFQNANNGKNIVATAIGSPLSSADTFATMGSKIDGITNKFKDILQDKGISISSDDKYNSLVDKTSLLTLPKISIVGDDVVLYSKSGYFQAKGSPDESVVYISKELFLRGSIRIKMTADGNQQTASYKIKYRIVNEEGLVKSEKVYTINRNAALSMTTEFDNIEPYDKVELLYICPTSWKCQSQNLIISCNYA